MKLPNKRTFITGQYIFRLIYRSALFIWALITYVSNKQFHKMSFVEGAEYFKGLFTVIWLLFTLEMIARFFPHHTESIGCQKQFQRNYLPTSYSTGKNEIRAANKGAIIVAISWLVLNGIIALLYKAQLIRDGILLLIALFYSVADIICILFFCPFRKFMLKNRCCSTCRIFNWDFLMMFTPFILIINPYTLSLFALAFLLFLRWEITHLLHPERFYESSNSTLICGNCTEHLCQYRLDESPYEKKLKRLSAGQNT